MTITGLLTLLVLAVPQQPPRPTIRSGVELLVVDVQVVTDRGEPVLTLTGRVDRAQTILARLKETGAARYVSPYHLAYVHAGLGYDDEAIDCLEEAYETRAGGVYGMKG